MTRYEKIKSMDVEELAKVIINNGDIYIDDYCKSECDLDDCCPHPEECCKKWLLEELK